MARQVARTSGGFYAGVGAPLLAVIPAFAVTFGTFEWASARLWEREQQRNGTKGGDMLSLSGVATAGACAGLALGTVLGPFERIKCILQVRGDGSSVASVVRECRATGRSLVRGTGLTIAREVPGNVFYFGTYEAIVRSQQGETSKQSWATTLFAGGMAGIVNWIVAIPIDVSLFCASWSLGTVLNVFFLYDVCFTTTTVMFHSTKQVVKSRWQTDDSYKTISSCVRHLLATEGPSAFFKGLTPALLRAFPANAATFGGVAAAKAGLESCGLEIS